MTRLAVLTWLFAAFCIGAVAGVAFMVMLPQSPRHIERPQ